MGNRIRTRNSPDMLLGMILQFDFLSKKYVGEESECLYEFNTRLFQNKAYDRFQKLISLLEVHGAAVSNEDANQKFLRALPSSWNNVALIMRNKDGIDDLDIDDLYNNLKVFEADIKGLNSQGQASSSSYTDGLIRGHFARECRALRNQGKRNGDARYRSRDNTRRIVPMETSDALVVQDNALIIQDGLGYDCIYIAQDEPTEFALMAYTSNSSGSDIEANLEIIAYQLGLESIEAHVFDSRSSDGDDNQTNDRFKKDNGYHVVPPPLTGNYMPPLADLSFAGLNDSVYRPTTNKTSASMSQVKTIISQTSNTSVEMHRVESVRPSGVIIEDWVSDDDEDIFQSNKFASNRQT
ncbi:hypothetical protein Tco_1275948 [Tanacetum coccineum]